MTVNGTLYLVSFVLLSLVAGAAAAIVTDQASSSPLNGRQFVTPALEIGRSLIAVDAFSASSRPKWEQRLARLAVHPAAALLDRRGGRWGTLRQALPLIPGSGKGNLLNWADLRVARPLSEEDLGEKVRALAANYISKARAALRIDVSELDWRVGVADSGDLIHLSAERRISGLIVRGARFVAVVNHGNLVLMGAERWGDVEVRLTPTIPAHEAVLVVTDFVSPHTMTTPVAQPYLEILPTALDQARHAVGDGYAHRLAWVVRPHFEEDGGRWEALVDAHSGELLAFKDLNHYGTARNVKGGVYPASDGTPPDGSMVSGYPMPFADLSSGGFTDAGGNFTAAGSVTTTLDGQYIRIQDACGAISEESAGDIDLEGDDGDDNCLVPPGHSPGDTAGARTTYYELNRLREMAVSHLPANAWLNGQLTARTNEPITCAATWNGTEVIFYWHNDPCANTAQIAGVIDHEWGHGLDDNDVNGSIPQVSQGGGGGFADLVAAVRQNTACIGRGFFTDDRLCFGYGDPCTEASGCDGVRTVDFADRESGLPHDLTWVRQFCDETPQCVGAAYAETVWDIFKRDLPDVYGMDDNTALEVTTRLLVVGSGAVSGWFDLNGPDPGDAGCGANQAYLQFLATDDDDGDIDNGTPHMTAIAAAFDRHEIGCTPGGSTPGPIVQDSGCSPTPTTAPVVTAMATDMGAELSWSAVADAAEYRIFRTDGERQCELAKAVVGATVSTSFSDSGLQNGRDYSYVVIPMGAGGDSCFGPASDCVTVGDNRIFADGFESGDTSAWGQSVP